MKSRWNNGWFGHCWPEKIKTLLLKQVPLSLPSLRTTIFSLVNWLVTLPLRSLAWDMKDPSLPEPWRNLVAHHRRKYHPSVSRKPVTWGHFSFSFSKCLTCFWYGERHWLGRLASITGTRKDEDQDSALKWQENTATKTGQISCHVSDQQHFCHIALQCW